MYLTWAGLLTIQVLAASNDFEKNIRGKILTNYNADIRPGVDENKSTLVNFEFKMQTIMGFDIKNQVLTVRAFNLLKWMDEDLKWNSSEFNDVQKISVDSSLIWTPDVVLYNTAMEESFGHTDIYKSKIAVYNDGMCLWNAPAVWKISCTVDITWFPIDTQKCDLMFGSWSYTSSQMKVVFREKPKEQNNLKSDFLYVNNGEWDILEINAEEKNVLFPCCKDPFTVVIYTLVLRRLSLYYFLYVILPFISLAFLCLFIYHIPPESGERMGFGVTVILSITVYLLVISEKLPEKSDDTPMLGIIFITTFYILCFALAQSLFTMVLSYRSTKPPGILSRIIRCCCCWRSNKKMDLKNDDEYVDARPMRNKINDKYAGKTKKDLKDDNNIEWKKIARFFDNVFHFMYTLILIAIPFIVISFLPDYVKDEVAKIQKAKM